MAVRDGRETGDGGREPGNRRTGNDVETRKVGDKTVVLSERMQMLADMVTAGSSVADVGCDHAFLPIYLVQTGKSPKCLAMDVRKGPLSGAEEHIASRGLGEYIEARLSDGLSAYHTGEAQTLICAGMGGRLMEKILTEGGEKSRSFSELILQPQSEIPEFRIFLRNAGFLITEEDAVYEEGRFYFAMKAVYTGERLSAGENPPAEEEACTWQNQPAEQETDSGQSRFTEQRGSAGRNQPVEWETMTVCTDITADELYDLYGKQLLLKRHPVLKQFLLKRVQAVEELMTQLRRKDSAKGEARQRELSLEREYLERALAFFGKGW